MVFGRTTEIVKALIGHEMSQVSVAVDATMGNGNDTLFLSQLVGREGHVFAFDIQQTALERTKAKLEQAGASNVSLIKDCHSKMKKYLSETDLIMFNLGYLPKGDPSVITLEKSTCEAVKRGLEILKASGLMTIISYYGHPRGSAEKEGLVQLLKALNPAEYEVVEVTAFNKANNPPIVYMIRKN